MKRLTSGLFLGLLFVVSGCQTGHSKEPLTLAKDGKTNYVIVESDDATEPETFAAKDLAEFLGRVTGAEFPIVKESADAGDGKRIYVGWTKFAADEGIDCVKLGHEEWIIRTVGDDLIITGGRPRGTMFGVHEFLEEHVGCHWLDADTEVVPDEPTLTVGPLDIQDKPFFWRRMLGCGLGINDQKWMFLVRNKNYRQKLDRYPKGAFHKVYGSPGSVHTFSKLVNGKDHFEAHPEYFSLVQGKRLPANSGAGPGQLCLTNPGLLRLVVESLRGFIEKDRAEAKEKGVPPPKAYWICQNDRYDAHCQCAACQAIAKREEGESGPLIEFVNAVAERLEKDYPDILVGTLAYNQTSMTPKNVKPRDNVIVAWCDVYGKCDGIRPLSHTYNKENYDEITGWGKISPHLAIGDDYWTALSYYKYFPTPWAMIDCMASDLKLYADLGVEAFFAETADYLGASQQFVPLKHWLAYQLLVDPYQPLEPLLQTFMNGFYGKAGPKMREYLRYLRKRIDADAQFKMLRDEPHKLAYLDLEFFKTSEKLFDEAEALVKPKSLAARHVSDERFTLDGALLYLWPWLERKLPRGESMPFDKETVIKRYEREFKSFGRYSTIYTKYKRCLNEDGKLCDRLAGLFRNPQIPAKFAELPSRDVADFNWTTFANFRPRRQTFVPDDEAVGGMAATFAEKSAIQKAEAGGDQADATAAEQFRKPLTFGVTGGPTITLKPEEIPQDGKYHLHKIGRIRLKPKTMVWALDGKRLGVCVDRIFVPGAEDSVENDWNAYVSLKLQGPAYVKGSTKPNGVWLDRVLLVKPQPGEPIDDAFKKQLKEERRRAALRPKIKVPKLAENVAGDPLKVDWSKAVDGGKWWTLKGEETDRKVSAKFAHDDQWLYLKLTETMDTKRLVNSFDVWSGDDWELFLVAKRGMKPYRQIAINSWGKHVDLAYGEHEWKSGAVVHSKVDPNRWTVIFALPLTNLIHGKKLGSGDTVYVNCARGGKNPLIWSPTYSESFQDLDDFGEFTLE